MTTDQALRFLDALGRAGVATISFSGGEPLLREDLDLLARRALSWGIRPTVNTSGVLAVRHLDRLRSMDLVKLSLDGPEDVNDSMRGRGSYRAAVRGLDAMLGAGLKVRLVTTLTRANCAVGVVEHLLCLAESHRIGVLFQVFHPHGDALGLERFAPTPDQAEEVSDYLADRRFQGRRGLDNALYSLGFLRGRRHRVPLACQGGRLFVIVDALGRMTPCDRVRPVPEGRWTGGEFRVDGLSRVPTSECRGCAFSGSLTLNVLGNGPRGLAFVGEAMLREAAGVLVRKARRPRWTRGPGGGGAS